ncbi:hypothetical protein ACROYT_G030892 [Oculina patagonica]
MKAIFVLMLAIFIVCGMSAQAADEAIQKTEQARDYNCDMECYFACVEERDSAGLASTYILEQNCRTVLHGKYKIF